jgi:beta-fructofuranosidase
MIKRVLEAGVLSGTVLCTTLTSALFFTGCGEGTLPGIGEDIVRARTLRRLIQSDPHRPTYHFVAPEGRAYPFDPNGAIFWKGKYHLGFIYQYLGNGRREHFWGHAVSADLLHWALYPDMLDVKEGDPEEGIFSGGAFLSREGVPHIIYHGWGSGSNLVAYSTDDDLREWKKFKGNPVLGTPGEGDPLFGKYEAWDPEGWYDAETDYYYQISGGDVAAFFRSRDMQEWEYLGDLIDQDHRMRHDFEDLSCPDFFEVGDKHMLLFISHNLGAQYYLGEFKQGRFHVESHARMNWPGGTFFAPEQLVDDQGRNIIWGWVLERRPELMDWVPRWSEEGEDPRIFPPEGWSGIMSLPRVVSLSAGGEVRINPPEELRRLRLEGIEEAAFTLEAHAERTLPIRGKALEISLEATGGSSPHGLKVFCSPDGREQTVIQYDPARRELVIDFARSAASGDGQVKMKPNAMLEPKLEGFTEDVSEQKAPLDLLEGEPLKLDVFIDRSVIEVFANGRLCMTQVVYPELSESDQVRLFTRDGEVQVLSARAWTMAPTNAY